MKAENGGLYEHLSGLSKAELMDRASALVRHTSVEPQSNRASHVLAAAFLPRLSQSLTH